MSFNNNWSDLPTSTLSVQSVRVKNQGTPIITIIECIKNNELFDLSVAQRHVPWCNGAKVSKPQRTWIVASSTKKTQDLYFKMSLR